MSSFWGLSHDTYRRTWMKKTGGSLSEVKLEINECRGFERTTVEYVQGVVVKRKIYAKNQWKW